MSISEISRGRYSNEIGLQRWIMDNIEVVNLLSAKGLIPVEIETNDRFVRFKQVYYPVTYSWDPDIGTVTRVDRIHESL